METFRRGPPSSCCNHFEEPVASHSVQCGLLTSGTTSIITEDNSSSSHRLNPPRRAESANLFKKQLQCRGDAACISQLLLQRHANGATFATVIKKHLPRHKRRPWGSASEHMTGRDYFQCSRCAFTSSSRLGLSMHVSQVHRPRVQLSGSRLRGREAELYRRLKLLAPEARRTLIEKRFSQAQRLSLERWILAQSVAENRFMLRGQRRLSGDPRGLCADPKMWRRGSPCVYSRHCGTRVLYAATGAAGPFRLFTRSTPDAVLAAKFRDVLAAIRRQVIKISASTPEVSFARALVSEPLHAGLDAVCDMGLCFVAAVAARHWVGRQLLTPRYSASDVESGLRAWRRLHGARSRVYIGHSNGYSILRHHNPSQLDAAWSELREVYLSIWSDAGRDASKVAVQLQKLEDRHQASRERLRARWARSQMSASVFSSHMPPGRELLGDENVQPSNAAPCSDTAKAVRRVEELLVSWNCRSKSKRKKLCDMRH